MNKSFLKFVADFGPLLIFFSVYYKSGNNLIVAIPPLVISTIIAVIAIYLLEKKIPYIPLIGGIIITLFGGLTLYFDNPVFLYMKPTIVNIIFGIGRAIVNLCSFVSKTTLNFLRPLEFLPNVSSKAKTP